MNWKLGLSRIAFVAFVGWELFYGTATVGLLGMYGYSFFDETQAGPDTEGLALAGASAAMMVLGAVAYLVARWISRGFLAHSED